MMYNLNAIEIARDVDENINTRKKNSHSRQINDAFKLTDFEFTKTYRLSKNLVRELIDVVEPHMPANLRSDGLETTMKVLVALAFYASGSYQRLAGQSRCHSISQPAVSRAIQQVTEVLNLPQIFHEYVRFPNSREDRDDIKGGFYRNFGIPGVVGCIDGTHIAIVPPKVHEERYYNRKGYHSLNTLIICDANARILCVDSSNPGSTHDSAAWNSNPLQRKLDEIVQAGEDFYLLGDSGFPLRRVMMTPILNADLDTPEAHYTEKHVSTRNVVERCIGILKARFRCLIADRKLHYKPHVAAKIVNACCVLHNMGLKMPEMSGAVGEVEGENNIDAQTDPDSLARADRRSALSNDLLQQGRNYQQALVSRLWMARR